MNRDQAGIVPLQYSSLSNIKSLMFKALFGVDFVLDHIINLGLCSLTALCVVTYPHITGDCNYVLPVQDDGK